MCRSSHNRRNSLATLLKRDLSTVAGSDMVMCEEPWYLEIQAMEYVKAKMRAKAWFLLTQSHKKTAKQRTNTEVQN